MNPNENDFTRDEPLPAQQFQPHEEDIGSTGREQFRRAKEEVSTQISQTWDQTKEKASLALERTEDFVRENPVPTILGALGLGIAIGLAIRYAAPSERKREIVMESPWGNSTGAFSRCHFSGRCSNRPAKNRKMSCETALSSGKNGRGTATQSRSANAGKRGRAERTRIQGLDHKSGAPGKSSELTVSVNAREFSCFTRAS